MRTIKFTILLFTLVITLTAAGQSNTVKQINNHVATLETNNTNAPLILDYGEVMNIFTDGGGVIKVYKNLNTIYKIEEIIGLSYGRKSTTLYLKNEVPIKITETEETYKFVDGELDYTAVNLVFKAEIFIINWNTNETLIKRKGDRTFSQVDFSKTNYEAFLQQVKNAIPE